MKKISLHSIPLLLIAVASCELPNDETIQADTPPEVRRITLYPTLIDVDDIASAVNAESVIDTAITIAVDVKDLNADLSGITASVTSADGNIIVANILLTDNGVLPDSAGDDGVFFGTADISFKKKEIGIYTVAVSVLDSKSNDIKVLSYLEIVNTFNKAPILSNLQMQDTVFIPTGQDSTLLKFSVDVQDQQGLTDIFAVNTTIISEDGLKILTVRMYDDGGTVSVPPYSIPSGDLVANDGIFTTRVPFGKVDVGPFFAVHVTALDSAQAVSNSVSKNIYIRNQFNSPPAISNLDMPDTVYVPTGFDTSFVVLRITATDQQGLVDILSVYFTSFRPDNSVAGTFFLKDDGSADLEPQFNIFSGDSVANDGRYTLTIPLFSGAATNTYRDFVFQAKDRSGEVSATITKRIYQK